MSRPASLLTVFSFVYVALLVLLAFSVGDGNTGIVWGTWILCGAVVLSSTALELTLLVFWLNRQGRGMLSREPYVPETITNAAREALVERSPAVAILMPAHREVTTPEDAAAFAARIVNIVRRTPQYSTLFLLFDSPEEQHENEVAVVEVIRSRLRRIGWNTDAARVRMETYRHKPLALKNKPGSIEMWLERYGGQFEYMFVLDADSSMVEEDPSRPATRDVLARLVLAMDRHPELAMIQTAIDVHTEPTLWGWVQRVGVRMASRYHGRLFQWLLEGTVPSYGHSVLFRVSDFVNHVKNTLEYLSHDFLDAADLATAGRKCVQTYAAVTCEEGEASLLGYLKRDLRWARGNAQWANYWWTKPRLPLGPRIYLAVGILCYVWPLLASVVFVTSVFLAGAGVTLFSASHGWALQLLLSCVFVSLVVPKALAAGSLVEFGGSLLIGIAGSPAVMTLQGFLFLIGAFGTKWTLRGTRSAKLDFDHFRAILRLFLPVSLLGLFLWVFFLDGMTSRNFGAVFIRVHLMLMVVSPLLALILSCPLPAALQRSTGPPEAATVRPCS